MVVVWVSAWSWCASVDLVSTCALVRGRLVFLLLGQRGSPCLLMLGKSGRVCGSLRAKGPLSPSLSAAASYIV